MNSANYDDKNDSSSGTLAANTGTSITAAGPGNEKNGHALQPIQKLSQDLFYFVSGRWDKIMPSLWTEERAQKDRQGIIVELKSHRLAAILLLSFVLCSKTILLWLLFVIVWSCGEQLYALLPQKTKSRCYRVMQLHLGRPGGNDWLDQMEEAVAYTRPFFLISLYLCCAPLALLWMTSHWCARLLNGGISAGNNRAGNGSASYNSAIYNSAAHDCPGHDVDAITDDHQGQALTLILAQNKEGEIVTAPTNFFHSPAFALTSVAIFAAGLPAAFTLFLYRYLQIDAMLGNPSADPRFGPTIVGISFYLLSLAWCLSVLFFRAWFTFPLNFLSGEYDLTLDQRRIKRGASKGWLLSVLTMNNPATGARQINWTDVITVTARNATGGSFYPLPDAAFVEAPALLKKSLNKVAFFYDLLSHKIDDDQLITISTAQKSSSWGREMDINVSQLSSEEKTQLFYCLRKWAPQAIISDEAQKRLIGSNIFKETRYTEIWFDLLKQKNNSRNDSALPSAELKPGDLLRDSSIQIIKILGRGGQATAYLARKKHDESHDFVLKEFILSDCPQTGAKLQSAGEFELEASLLSRLEHPRIVKLLDFFAENGRLYLSLEHVGGRTLRQIVKEKGALPERQVIDIAREMCQVIGYLHGQNPPIIHRDLAPDNIIYQSSEGIKLIDFSLACQAQAAGSADLTGLVDSTASAIYLKALSSAGVGKHAYTPPEQFRQQALPQSDIYALGATMYFLLTGQDAKALTQSSPRRKNPLVSEALDEIVRQATALDADERYESIAWLGLALEGQ